MPLHVKVAETHNGVAQVVDIDSVVILGKSCMGHGDGGWCPCPVVHRSDGLKEAFERGVVVRGARMNVVAFARPRNAEAGLVACDAAGPIGDVV